MNLRHCRRSWLAVALLLVGAAFLIGCSKSPTRPNPPPPIPHADADDVVQLIATTLAADHGGWYFLVKAFAESLSVPAPRPMVAASAFPGLRGPAPLSSGTGVQNTFLLTSPNPGIIYYVQAQYIRLDQTVTTTRDSASQDLQALVAVDGGTFANANGLSGTYGAHTYALNGPIDETFFVTNLHKSTGDTLEFNGFLDDSCFANVRSTISGTDRLWFHINFVDWNLRIPKNKLRTAPYPVARNSEIHWTIDAKGLATPRRDDWGVDYLIEAHMTFNGTPDAFLALSNLGFGPDWVYTYKVNVNTGSIARLN